MKALNFDGYASNLIAQCSLQMANFNFHLISAPDKGTSWSVPQGKVFPGSEQKSTRRLWGLYLFQGVHLHKAIEIEKSCFLLWSLH